MNAQQSLNWTRPTQICKQFDVRCTTHRRYCITSHRESKQILFQFPIPRLPPVYEYSRRNRCTLIHIPVTHGRPLIAHSYFFVPYDVILLWTFSHQPNPNAAPCINTYLRPDNCSSCGQLRDLCRENSGPRLRVDFERDGIESLKSKNREYLWKKKKNQSTRPCVI